MKLPIIPRPQTVVLKEGRSNTNVRICYVRDETMSDGGYAVTVGKDGVEARFNTYAGRFYADQTLKMLKDTLGYYPYVEITDAPKNHFRAVMLDVGRYFFPLEDVKSLIDDASALKLNVLYIHLTEDQGWRAAIESRPNLEKVGSKREKTNCFFKKCEGCYSVDEMREIVAYAHCNQMIVIPEVDVPGHVRSAIAAYPEIACFPRELPVATHWGVKHDILCAGKEATYRFLYEVFSSLTEIFTDGYFGLGGDEAVKTRWKLCPDCQRVIREQGLKDEDALQTYFMNRLNREFFKPRGLRPIVWVDGTAPEGIDKDFVLMFYGGKALEESIKTAATAGYSVINANSDYYYLDFPNACTPLSKCYRGGLTEEPSDRRIGGLLSIWTEFIPNRKTLEKRVFPRILAGAEGLWSNYDPNEYNDFVERAEAYYRVYGENRNFTTIRNADPRCVRAGLERVWWARRPLYWEGLGNLIDNAKVARIAKNSEKNKEI